MADYQSQFTGPQIDQRLAAVTDKQDRLVSGTNIKTVGGQSILGRGDIPIQAGDTNAVQYVAQELTEAQKQQARANINAASLADIQDMDFVTATERPTASASTMGHIYLIGPDANNNYDRYYTQESNGTYSWVSLGSTQIDLSTYATKSELSQLQQKVTDLQDGETVLQQQIDAIHPVIIEGNVENAPDGEDIITDENNRLKFANRSATLTHKGYKILRSDKSFADQVTDINTTYEIRYAFDLDSESVTIPSGCVLSFNGGHISNGTIIGNHTIVTSSNDSIFSSILFSGTFDTPFNAEWILSPYDANADYTVELTSLFNCGATRIVFTAPYRYKVTDTIVINNDIEISSSIKFTGERNGGYPNIYCESNKTVVHYKHTDSHKKVRIGGIAVYSGDKTNPDYSTPIVKMEYLAGGWAGSNIDLHILDNYESESYDGSSYERHGMVGIEVDVVSGSFTLSEIGGSISCYKALYIHRSGTGFITDVNISARIEAAYGGEVEGSKFYLRGEFQTFAFPNDVPAIRPSECFFYGGEGYSEDSFIWDLGTKKGNNNLISSVKYGTDGSAFSQVATIPGRSLPNMPTEQSSALLSSSNGEYNTTSQLVSLTIECSQDDFSTILLSESDVVNINGLFGGKRMLSSETDSSKTELELYGAFLNPGRVSSVGINTSNPLQVRTTARYRMASAHWARFFTYRSGSFLVTIRKYSDSGYTNLVEEYTRRLDAMMEGNSQTMRESFCFVETSDYYYTEIVYVYNTMISDVQVYGQNTYQLIGFNVFNFKTSGDTKQFVSSPIIENDWQISRESAKNIYVPLNGSRCNQGFHIIAPTTLSVNLEVDFEVTPADSNFPDYGGVSATRGRLIVRTNGTVQITGVRDTTVGFYKSDHEISGLSYYRLFLASCWVKVLRITARHILLKLGTNGSTSVGTNQTSISNTKYRVVGASTDRPTLVANDVGYIFFDKTISKPIWWTGTGWVDATGATV